VELSIVIDSLISLESERIYLSDISPTARVLNLKPKSELFIKIEVEAKYYKITESTFHGSDEIASAAMKEGSLVLSDS